MNTWVDSIKDQTLSATQPGTFQTERHGYVDVQYGLNDKGDFFWHFTAASKHKPFPQNIRPIITIVTKYLDKVIPADIEREVDTRVMADWEIKPISFYALEVGKHWRFDEENYTKYVPKMCDEITQYIKESLDGANG